MARKITVTGKSAAKKADDITVTAKSPETKSVAVEVSDAEGLAIETTAEVMEIDEKGPKKNKVSSAKKAKKPKKVKLPKPPKQKKEKRSLRKQREKYERMIKKARPEKALSLLAIGLAVVGAVLQALIVNEEDKMRDQK